MPLSREMCIKLIIYIKPKGIIMYNMVRVLSGFFSGFFFLSIMSWCNEQYKIILKKCPVVKTFQVLFSILLLRENLGNL